MAATDGGRLGISLSLKAARWLAGGIDHGGKRRPVKPLSVDDLAAREVLRENRVTANRLEDIEQMKVAARPLELEAISQALGVDLRVLRTLREGVRGAEDDDGEAEGGIAARLAPEDGSPPSATGGQSRTPEEGDERERA